jgi:hypothetical protein
MIHNLKLHKWRDNLYMELADEWCDTFVELGVEPTVRAAIEEGVINMPELYSALRQALSCMENEEQAERMEQLLSESEAA